MPGVRSTNGDTHLGGDDFDLVHDNQCLGSGVLGMMQDGWPVTATIHHPITVDRELDRQHVHVRARARVRQRRRADAKEQLQSQEHHQHANGFKDFNLLAVFLEYT